MMKEIYQDLVHNNKITQDNIQEQVIEKLEAFSCQLDCLCKYK